jgi:hypothetical protein
MRDALPAIRPSFIPSAVWGVEDFVACPRIRECVVDGRVDKNREGAREQERAQKQKEA